jgi:hypothetical protein
MPRFVILEHDWNGRHWDVMLESGDVLRTWAVAERPEPGRDLPARPLADHRLAYLEYEGPITGGRGTVRRVDRGEYDVVSWSESRVVVELRGGRYSGPAELRAEASGTPAGAFTWTLRLGKVD